MDLTPTACYPVKGNSIETIKSQKFPRSYGRRKDEYTRYGRPDDSEIILCGVIVTMGHVTGAQIYRLYNVKNDMLI